jgi:hypothetical protein
MKQLIEDYQRRLDTANELLKEFKSNGSINDIKKEERLTTKASEYRTIIVELERLQAARNTDYFKIVPIDDKDRIEIECGRNGHLFLIRTDEGMVVDVYANGNDEIVDTLAIWDEDMNNKRDFTDDLSDNEQHKDKPTDGEIVFFKRHWGQSHVDICESLGYDIGTADDLLMVDYFWIEDTGWFPIISSAYTEREQEIADYMRHNS